MNFLALDTSSNACTVAVQVGGRKAARHVVEAKAHTRILMPFIRELMEECGIAVADLDAVILGIGPGSFIGVRIGASVAQGICFGAGLKIVPISSLAAVAAEVFAKSGESAVVVAQDARMSEAYMGQFSRGPADQPILIDQERIVAADGLLSSIDVSAVAGGAWNRYPSSMDGIDRDAIEILPYQMPDARYLLDLGAAAYVQGLAVDPVDIKPAYLRTKVAEKPAGARQSDLANSQ